MYTAPFGTPVACKNTIAGFDTYASEHDEAAEDMELTNSPSLDIYMVPELLAQKRAEEVARLRADRKNNL